MINDENDKAAQNAANNGNNPDDTQQQDENVVPIDDAMQAKDNVLTPDEQIEQLQNDLLQARDRTMRALADAENTRKRAMKDREDAGKFAIAKFARSMLDFSDNFERAIEAIPQDIKETDERVKNVVEGIEAMQRELLGVFEQNGIKKIEPLDQPFDANFHEVMFETPIPGKSAGTIIQVIEAGYVLNERLLRAAKVGIAKGDAGAPPTSNPGTTINESA